MISVLFLSWITFKDSIEGFFTHTLIEIRFHELDL